MEDKELIQRFDRIEAMLVTYGNNLQNAVQTLANNSQQLTDVKVQLDSNDEVIRSITASLNSIHATAIHTRDQLGVALDRIAESQNDAATSADDLNGALQTLVAELKEMIGAESKALDKQFRQNQNETLRAFDQLFAQATELTARMLELDNHLAENDKPTYSADERSAVIISDVDGVRRLVEQLLSMYTLMRDGIVRAAEDAAALYSKAVLAVSDVEVITQRCDKMVNAADELSNCYGSLASLVAKAADAYNADLENRKKQAYAGLGSAAADIVAAASKLGGLVHDVKHDNASLLAIQRRL